MAYTWTNGELITADKLNQTGGGDIVFVGIESDTLDMTWQEIYDAMSSNKFLVNLDVGLDYADALFVTSAYVDDGRYWVSTTASTFVTSSANGYPEKD